MAQFERKKRSKADYSSEGTLGSRVLASARFNGPYKNNRGRKKLYYSRQCQLVWHAAVSPTLLPIHKKKKKKKNSSYPPLASSHVAPGRTETERSQKTVGLVPPSVCCRKSTHRAKICLA